MAECSVAYDVGDQPLGRQATFDQPRRRRCLHHRFLAGAAGVFRPAGDDHLVLRGDDVEPLRAIFADHMHRAAAARAGGVFRFDDDFDPRQVLRQRPAAGAPLLRTGLAQRRIGLLLFGFAGSDRHPDARFIIDHMGIQQPSVPPAPPLPWVDLPKVVELAKRKNAVIKITGACTLSKEPYPFPDIWDPLARIFDAWGFERCLWGTDWTRAFAVVNYEQGVEPFLKTDRLSDTERAVLMGAACAKAYGWSPKKA